MVPMARPSLMTIILLNGLASWNSFMWPMYVIVSKRKPHAAVGSSGLYDGGRLLSGTADGRIYGCGFPVVILFLFARKYIVRGVARGGLKG